MTLKVLTKQLTPLPIEGNVKLGGSVYPCLENDNYYSSGYSSWPLACCNNDILKALVEACLIGTDTTNDTWDLTAADRSTP